MTEKEIVTYIKDNEPWTGRKEMELVHKLGGATKWGEDYYITYSYKVAVDKIEDAIKELAKESTVDPREFVEEMREMQVGGEVNEEEQEVEGELENVDDNDNM